MKKKIAIFNMLRKMSQKFRNYKSCKFNINLIILHISPQEKHLVRWSWLQSWCLQGERAQVRILAATFFFNFSLFHDRFNQPMIQPVFWVEPWFVQFSQNHVYLVLIVKKTRFITGSRLTQSDQPVRPEFKSMVQVLVTFFLPRQSCMP